MTTNGAGGAHHGPPEGIILWYANGTQETAKPAYRGYSGDVHYWVVETNRKPVSVTVECIPEHTALGIAVTTEEP